VARMEAEPDLGILAFQAIGPEFPERMTEAGRLQGEFHCCSFAACGAAIRRSALARLDPLPEYFFHMYEESDLALRVWNAGYRVLQWNEITVYHAFDPRCRNELRNHFLHARNEACSVIMRYPWALLLPGLMTRLLTQFRYAWRRGWWWKEPAVWLAIAARLPVALAHRRPVTARTVRISLGVNRVRTKDPQTAWALGDQSWWNILVKRPCNSPSNG
jgi:GT2 family glycosyltransferase